MNSKDKGKRGERHIAKVLRERGYDAKRGVQYQGSPDSPDVIGLPGVHIEVKFTEHLNIWQALAQSERDAGENEIPVVVFKRNRSGDYIALSFGDFLDVFGTAYGNANLLKCAIAIRDFLTDKGCSSTQYWDEDGNEIMHTDIGYFDEGLDELIEYLQGKEKQDNG